MHAQRVFDLQVHEGARQPRERDVERQSQDVRRCRRDEHLLSDAVREVREQLKRDEHRYERGADDGERRAKRARLVQVEREPLLQALV